MRSGAQRLAQQNLAARAASLPDWPTATVIAVAAGGGTDGQDLATVDHDGAELELPHMAHYTPVVGDVVVLIRVGGSWTILGRPVGFPST